MRIVHTADWHVGRVWKNVNRLDEMQAVLDHLARFIERGRIDLLLVAGDVFDASSPAADAERIVFGFFHRLSRIGVASVVIAGNHDHPTRVDAWGTLASLAGVRTVGRPRSLSQGGVLTIPTRHGVATVAALPFAAGRAWAQVLETAGESIEEARSYHAMFRRAFRHLSAGFGSETVNLAVAHTHVQGALVGTSERPLHLGPEWAVLPGDFPAAAQYVALGHVHRPQSIVGAPVETRFSGSPLQFDFGEAGEEKSFVLIEAAPGQPVRSELIPFEGGRSLGDLRTSLEQLDEVADEVKHFGWLRVTVPMEKSDPDLARKVRERLPNAIVVHAEVPEPPRLVAPRPALGASAVDQYRAYVRHSRGEQEPAPALLGAFTDLYESARGDCDAPAPAVA
jgi:exonuclease SbcD